tara:strand:- start:565 stop:1155 length:591 start_codon:yes stop_codon:yes gene_type:complete
MKYIFCGFIIFSIFAVNLTFSYASEYHDNKIKIIEESWNNIRTMSGNFLQTNSDGTMTYGKFFLSKPFKSKFVYKNEEDIIVTNQSLIAVLDNEGYQLDSYPIGQSPLKDILRDKVDLIHKDKKVIIKEDEENYIAKIRFSNKPGEVELSFTKDDLTLKKWQIIDEFEQVTVLEFTKIKKNISINPEIYSIRYKKD